MYDISYDSCSKCRKLIPDNPYANIADPQYRPAYTMIDNNKFCISCAEKEIAARGIVETPHHPVTP